VKLALFETPLYALNLCIMLHIYFLAGMLDMDVKTWAWRGTNNSCSYGTYSA